MAKLLAGVQGVLLPGSRYDVDPQRYGEARAPECADDDPARTAADELLLQDAFNLRKPDPRHLPRRADAERVARRRAGSGFEDGR